MTEIEFTVPLIPPSVNSYVRHTRSGRHYVTKEAKAFKEAVAVCGPRGKREAKSYRVDVVLYLGKGQRLDLDNCTKVIGDGLKDAGLIHSDAAIGEWRLQKFRDAKEPRTEIKVVYL